MPSSLLGSWIDLDAATDAARQLCSPLEPAPKEDPGAGQGDGSEEIPSSRPPPALQRRLVAIRGRAERNGLLARENRADPARSVDEPLQREEGDADAAGPFRVPFGPMTVRVRALADWMQYSFAPASVFVADDHGQPLVEFSGGGDLLAAAAVLGDAVQRARRHLPGELGAEVVHLTLAPDQVLSLISTPTPLGTWQAGLTTSSPLGHHAVRLIVRALKKTAE
jgi:hypothetical protein